MTNKTGIIILAAGNSLRMGQPKQLLRYKGKSLIRHVTDEALANEAHMVLVVLGAKKEAIANELKNTPAQCCTNPDWEKGMASSIQTGLKSLLALSSGLESCIIAVCDQPHVNSELFESLKLVQKATGKGIVAAGYARTWGVPVLFTKPYFDSLLQLEGREGAKKIIRKHMGDMAVFPFEQGEIDMDTMADYDRLINQMISVQEAQTIINNHLPSNNRKKLVGLADAFGHALAADVIAKLDIPNFAQSSMDGYAIRFKDKDQTCQVVDEIPAGATEQKQLKPGQAMRVFTGAPLPIGADTVVMQEKVQLNKQNALVILDEELSMSLNVRPKGSEVSEDTIAMKADTYLSAAAIGYLAGIGCTHVEVFETPKMAIILTGDELREPGQPLAFGQVYESNSFQLRSALTRIGVHAVDIHRAKDNVVQLQSVLEEAIEKNDCIILVGGVSVGDYDYVVEVAENCGIEQRFHRVKQKPGKPLFFGTKGEKLVFGLPGNPSSALTCFYVYVAPALEKLMRRPNHTKKLKARATHAYSKKNGLTHFLKAYFDGISVTPLHAQESYRLHSFAQANCLMVLDEQSGGCQAGDEVEVRLLDI